MKHTELEKYTERWKAVDAAQKDQDRWSGQLWRVWFCESCQAYHAAPWKECP